MWRQCSGILVLLASAVTALPGVAQEAYRDDGDRVDHWVAQPGWLGAPDNDAQAVSRNGAAHFIVNQPRHGMKWTCALDDVAPEYPAWLVVTYRARGLDLANLDYLVHVSDARGGDGVRALRPDVVKVDGAPHTVCVNLEEVGVLPPLAGLAVSCFAGDRPAELEIDSLVITSDPPTGAEGYHAPTAPSQGRRWPIDGKKVAQWTLQPKWVDDFGPQARAESTADGVRFHQPQTGTGAKWSLTLPQPITGARWLKCRYRAHHYQTGGDYAIYVADDTNPDGKSVGEQDVVARGEVLDDGDWHPWCAAVKLPSISRVAVHLQAAGPDAWLELADLSFCEDRPTNALTDLLAYQPGWPETIAPWRPVAPPAGDLSAEAIAARSHYAGWFTADRIVAGGVPFALAESAKAGLATPIRDDGEISLALSGRAASLRLLLDTTLTLTSSQVNRPGSTHVERSIYAFRAQIEYEDGLIDEQLPWHCISGDNAAGRPELIAGPAVYDLALDPNRTLRRLVLRDTTRRGALALLAATLSPTPGPATAGYALQPAAAPAAPRLVAAPQPGIVRVGDALTITSTSLSLTLSTRAGLVVERATNQLIGKPLPLRLGPLFTLQVGDQTLTSVDFTVASVQTSARRAALQLTHDVHQVDLTFDLDDPNEIGLTATCAGVPADARGTTFVCPALTDVALSPNAADNWYEMPRRGAIVSNQPTQLDQRYAGAGNPTQIIGTFSPALGVGLYVMTQDRAATPRAYRLAKRNVGVDLAVAYTPFRPGSTPRTVIGCHAGGLQAQLQRYQRWVKTWYRPAAPRKDWFRRVFNFRQQFLSAGLFEPKTKTWRLAERLAQDVADFGGVDYLHLFDWGWDPVSGRCGNYEPWDYLGDAATMRTQVAKIEESGTPVGLYLEGYLVEPTSRPGAEHGAEWQLLNAAGQPYTFFAPSLTICPAVPAWREYLTAAYARTKKQTGAIGYYIDEFGFGAQYDCYNPAHPHPTPQTPILGEQATLKAIRAALGLESAIYTEESPVDVNAPYQDGSFTYAIASVTDEQSPSHLNLYRFVFPTFKTIEIITCDHPLGDDVDAVKRILFNGEAIWLEGEATRWFTPQVRAAIAANHRVLRANAACFAGDYPSPLAPTRYAGLYANRFAERADGRGKTCWTLYNTTYRTARGELIAVQHLPGAVYRDETTGQKPTARVVGDQAYLSLSAAPRDVVVISRTVN